MRRELVNSMLSMVTPRLAGMGRPSFCQVMKTGWSPDITTQGMNTRWPMEKRGNSKGWMVGGTGGEVWWRWVEVGVVERRCGGEGDESVVVVWWR